MTRRLQYGLAIVGTLGVLAFLFLPKKVKAGERILVVGDSLTGSPGYCGTLRQGLPKAEVRCLSKPGEGVKVIHAATMDMLRTFNPSTVVVLAGVNDIGSKRGLEYTKDALDELYHDLAGHGVKVVAVTLTPWSTHYIGSATAMQTETLRLNEWIRRHPVPSVVVETRSLYGQGKDGLHLTRAGGENLAKLVLSRLA